MLSAKDLPTAPAGYQWTHFSEIKAAFAQPEGWYMKEIKKNGSVGYFISKEDIDNEGAFKTGLIVNVVSNVPAKSGTAKFITQASQPHTVLGKPWSNQNQAFASFGVLVRIADPVGGDFMTHNLAIGNDQTGTVYLLVFEAPADHWELARKIAKPMLKNFLLDTDI